MNLLPVMPALLPLVFALITLLISEVRGRLVNFIGCISLFLVTALLWKTVWQAGTQVLQLGAWTPPFGIVFVIDLFSASMLAITGFVSVCVSLYLYIEENKNVPTTNYYFIGFQTLLAGVCGSFSTGDLFNLYVWFEVMLMSSFMLIAFDGRKSQLEGGLKYTILNLVASVFFLVAVGLLYASVGTLNMAHLAQRIQNVDASLGIQSSFALLLIAFGMKAGVFPLFFWLPASYHTPRVATSALLAGLLTKVGVYSLFRVSTLIFPQTISFSQNLFLAVACLTMVTGVLGAAFYYDIKKILSFHIISQIGYMILGLAFWTPAAIAASLFYIFHHIIVKTNLFLIGGAIAHRKGTTDLTSMGGLYKEYPILAFLFLIPALSLAGLPPLSGFFAKLGLLQSGVNQGEFLGVGVALAVGILTLYSMTKIWNEAFWKPQPDDAVSLQSQRQLKGLLLPIALMASATATIGLWPELLFAPATRMSEELLNPAAYIKVVLGENSP